MAVNILTYRGYRWLLNLIFIQTILLKLFVFESKQKKAKIVYDMINNGTFTGIFE